MINIFFLISLFSYITDSSLNFAANNEPLVIGVFAQFSQQNVNKSALEKAGLSAITRNDLNGITIYSGVEASVTPLFKKIKGKWIVIGQNCPELASVFWQIPELAANTQGNGSLDTDKICRVKVKAMKAETEKKMIAISGKYENSNSNFASVDLKNLNPALFKKSVNKKLLKAYANGQKFIISYHDFKNADDEEGTSYLEIKEKSGKLLFSKEASSIDLVAIGNYDDETESELLLEVSESTGGNSPVYLLISDTGKTLAEKK